MHTVGNIIAVLFLAAFIVVPLVMMARDEFYWGGDEEDSIRDFRRWNDAWKN